MMKKVVLGVTVAALVSVSSSCFAGFALPKLPKIQMPKVKMGNMLKAPTPKNNAVEEQHVDYSDLTRRQNKILKYTAAGLLNAADGVIEVKRALNLDTTKDVAARSALERDQSTKNISSLNKQIATGMPNKAMIDKVAAGTADQKATLKAALTRAETYKMASYVSLGTAAVHAGQAASEAASALKNIKDFTAIQNAAGLVKAFKMAGGMLPSVKKLYKQFDSNAASAKEALGVKQPSKAEINRQAKASEDGLGAFGL